MKAPDKTLLSMTISASLLMALVLAIAFPMVTDEAYYVDWATRSSWPSFGFFDHPPFVSWLASGVRAWHDILTARVVVWISSIISIYFIWKTAKILTPNRALAATALTVTTIGGIASGFLLTPDTGLALMWSIALHESVIAIRDNPKRWLTAGLATGLGLLSKYTMVLIGPVFLFGLIRDARKQLISPWPYLGGLVCLLIFAPHLWWQSQNNWITMKFQFGHGFSVKQSLSFASTLPDAVSPENGSAAMAFRDRLLASLSAVPGFSESTPSPKPEKSKWEQAWQYTGDYFGGVAGLWGIYAVAALIYPFLSRKKILPDKNPQAPSPERPIGSGVIEAAAFFPIIFFGLLSPFTKIEANWPAMHMAALAIWITSRRLIPARVICSVFLIHVAAICALGLILLFPELIPGARNNRMLLESKGYKALGQWVNEHYNHQAIAVDSYQLKSAIRYYSPETMVGQWPGITRGSEYTRGFIDDRNVESKLLANPQLTIIAMNSYPQIIPGFEVISFEGLRVCPDGTLGAFSESHPILPCKKGLREWWITTYQSNAAL